MVQMMPICDNTPLPKFNTEITWHHQNRRFLLKTIIYIIYIFFLASTFNSRSVWKIRLPSVIKSSSTQRAPNPKLNFLRKYISMKRTKTSGCVHGSLGFSMRLFVAIVGICCDPGWLERLCFFYDISGVR